jgi:hypothetical protein
MLIDWPGLRPGKVADLVNPASRFGGGWTGLRGGSGGPECTGGAGGGAPGSGDL